MSKSSRLIVINENNELLIGKTRFNPLPIPYRETSPKNSIGFSSKVGATYKPKTLIYFLKELRTMVPALFSLSINFDARPLTIGGKTLTVAELDENVTFQIIINLIGNVLPTNLRTGQDVHYINNDDKGLKLGFTGARWSFVGGDRESGESESKCVLREFCQETFFNLEKTGGITVNGDGDILGATPLKINTLYKYSTRLTLVDTKNPHGKERVFVLKVSNDIARDIIISWSRNQIYSEVFNLHFEIVNFNRGIERSFNEAAKEAYNLVKDILGLSSFNGINWKEKYLKYKAKYLALKK